MFCGGVGSRCALSYTSRCFSVVFKRTLVTKGLRTKQCFYFYTCLSSLLHVMPLSFTSASCAVFIPNAGRYLVMASAFLEYDTAKFSLSLLSNKFLEQT